MSDDSKRYNGWASYETWAVKLWMDNEQSSYNYWQDISQSVWDDRKRLEPWEKQMVTSLTLQTDRQRAVGRLAERLEDEHKEMAHQQVKKVSFVLDLLNAALGAVDWREIAESLLGEMADDTDELEAADAV